MSRYCGVYLMCLDHMQVRSTPPQTSFLARLAKFAPHFERKLLGLRVEFIAIASSQDPPRDPMSSSPSQVYGRDQHIGFLSQTLEWLPTSVKPGQVSTVALTLFFIRPPTPSTSKGLSAASSSAAAPTGIQGRAPGPGGPVSCSTAARKHHIAIMK